VGGENPVTEVSSQVSHSPHGPRRRRAVRLTAAVAGVVSAMGVAGCGIQPSEVKVVGAAPSLQAANDVTGTEDAGSGDGNQYELYFIRDGKLTPVLRYTDDTVTQELVLQALIAGPSSTDSAQGYTSAIPDDLSVVSYTAADQQWNYQYSESLTTPEKAEIVCTIQADLNAPAVGTYSAQNQLWNNCFDFSEYGAPAYLDNPASATPTDSGD
jgi:hypothetical protein